MKTKKKIVPEGVQASRGPQLPAERGARTRPSGPPAEEAVFQECIFRCIFEKCIYGIRCAPLQRDRPSPARIGVRRRSVRRLARAAERLHVVLHLFSGARVRDAPTYLACSTVVLNYTIYHIYQFHSTLMCLLLCVKPNQTEYCRYLATEHPRTKQGGREKETTLQGAQLGLDIVSNLCLSN